MKKYIAKKQLGFTLIEILIALVVVSIALAAATTARTHATSNANHLRDKMLAHWVAENRLTEIRIAKEFPAIGSEQSDDVEMGKIDWQWKQTVEKTDDVNLRRITISVYRAESGDSDEKPITFLNALVINPSQLNLAGSGQSGVRW